MRWDDVGWTPVPSASLAFGPIYITRSATADVAPLCLALQPTTGKIYAHALPLPTPTNHASSSANALLLDREELEAATIVEEEVGAAGPTDVHHVWVCTRIPDTEDRITLRSGNGKFLASDPVGIVTADREARGVQEEWTLVDSKSKRGILVKSSYGKYLNVDLIAGGKIELRADEADEAEGECWSIWMQGEYLAKARKAVVERSGAKAESVAEGLVIIGDMRGAENDYMYVLALSLRKDRGTDDPAMKSQKYQARGQGRLVSSAADIKDLKRARKEGNLGEAMLERRQKLKSFVTLLRSRCSLLTTTRGRSDRYC